MMISYITNVMNGEPDILSDLKRFPLVIRGLEGERIYMQEAPKDGWTHELLNSIQPDEVKYGADAYLGKVWIGSTEV